MYNIDIIVLIAGLCLIDGLRNGLMRAVVFLVENGPGILFFLFKNVNLVADDFFIFLVLKFFWRHFSSQKGSPVFSAFRVFPSFVFLSLQV